MFTRHHMRVLAIAMFAFPEPVISDALGVALFAASFLLPVKVSGADACSCGCDYHRSGCRLERPLGQGALLVTRVGHRLSPSHSYTSQKYGFTTVPAPKHHEVGALSSDVLPDREFHQYGWRHWPALDGTMMRRLGGYGASTAVRCEYKRPERVVARV